MAADAPSMVRVLQAAECPGYMPGMSQPCVVIDLIVRRDSTQTCVKRLQQVFRSSSPIDADSNDPSKLLASQIAFTTVAVLRKLGLTAFTEPSVDGLGARPEGDVFRLTIPAHPDCLGQTRQLLIEVAGVANGAASHEESRQMGSRIKTLLQGLKTDAPRGKNTLPMLETAHRLGVPWARVHGNIYCLGQGSKARWFNSSITDRTPSIAVRLAKDKSAAAAVFRSRGIPVPEHEVVTTEEEALVAAKRIGFPLVVKPVDCDGGIGVVAGLRTIDGMLAAFHAAKRHSKRILVESHFEGKDHRIHVFEGEVHRVRHRIPGGVRGNGVSTVRDLAAELNADPRRGARGSHAELIRIDLDEEALGLLTQQGLTADAVPALDEFIQLRRIANVSVGGVSVPVPMASVHPDNIALAVRAVGALKLDLAAVDFLIPDISKSWTEVGAAICEVNAQPQFGADAPELLFGRMLPGQGRIPTVGALFLGPQDHRVWIDALQEAVARAGTRLGFYDGSECWIGRQRIAIVQPTTAFAGARMLLAHDAVDALLLCGDASFLRLGLPVDRFDALLVLGTGTNLGETQLAQLMSLSSGQVFVDEPSAQQIFLEKAMPVVRVLTDRTALADAISGLLAQAQPPSISPLAQETAQAPVA